MFVASAEEPPVYIWNAGIGRWLRMDTTIHNSETRPLDGVLDQGFRYIRTTRRLCRESSLGRQMIFLVGGSEALPQDSTGHMVLTPLACCLLMKMVSCRVVVTVILSHQTSGMSSCVYVPFNFYCDTGAIVRPHNLRDLANRSKAYSRL